MAGDAGALARLVDRTSGDRVALGRVQGQAGHAVLLRIVGRQGRQVGGLQDSEDVALERGEGLADEVPAEGADEGRLGEGGRDAARPVGIQVTVHLRQGQRVQQLVLLKGSGGRQHLEVGVELRVGQLRVRETPRGVHAQAGIRRIDQQRHEQAEGGLTQPLPSLGQREQGLEPDRGGLRFIGGDALQRGVETGITHPGDGVQQQGADALLQKGLQRSGPGLVDGAGLGGDGPQAGLPYGGTGMAEHDGHMLGHGRL